MSPPCKYSSMANADTEITLTFSRFGARNTDLLMCICNEGLAIQRDVGLSDNDEKFRASVKHVALAS